MPRRIAAIIRDKIGRLLTHEHEVEREALRLITKNKELPLATRFRAQRLLGDFPRYGRYISLKDRCTVNGHARGVLPEFKLNRIAFRELALNGQLPGVKKAVW